MHSRPVIRLLCAVHVVAGIHLFAFEAAQSSVARQVAVDEVPTFALDTSWPSPLPNSWVIGDIGGVHVDQKDHVWVVQRPLSVTSTSIPASSRPAAGECCEAAPAVIEFDQAGTFVRAWGGADPKNPKGKRTAQGHEWPREHAMFIEADGSVWTGCDEPGCGTVTKLTRDGTLIFQRGRFGQSKGNGDTENFTAPTGVYVDPATNEAFVSDGYDGNRRIIVLDARTGAYKRMWGAYGKAPADDPPGCGASRGSCAAYNSRDLPAPGQFGHDIHCVELSRDGLVYVCDRALNRIQVFHKNGTFVREVFIERGSRSGTAADIAFSGDPDQRFMYVGDGSNGKVWILRRADLQIVGSVDVAAGQEPPTGQIHAMASDSTGNIYLGYVGGQRLRKLRFTGMAQRPR